MQSNAVDDRTKLTLRNQVELLCFRLAPGGTVFAVNVFKVREAVKFQELTELPESGEFAIDGLLTLRNEIIPVVDMGRWLYKGLPILVDGRTVSINDKDRQIIICEFNNVIIGIKVFKAEYILRKDWSQIHVPVSSEFGGRINNYTKNNKEEIVYIVDVESMLAELFPQVTATVDEETAGLAQVDIDKSRTLLIAEDSPVALKALCKVLDKLGVKYKSFVNGRLLLNYVESVDPATIGMIITDLEMPVASGFTVIKELKAKEATRKIPIVVNSSMTGESNQQMAASLNAEGFIGKTKPAEIASYVKRFMSRG